MSAYIIALIDIRDRERYREYEQGFMDVFAKYRGEMVAVDESPEVMEGDWTWTRTVLIRFPDAAEARRWYESDEYQALAQHRFAASSGRSVVVQGLD